jgi:hypothetical protein
MNITFFKRTRYAARKWGLYIETGDYWAALCLCTGKTERCVALSRQAATKPKV